MVDVYYLWSQFNSICHELQLNFTTLKFSSNAESGVQNVLNNGHPWLINYSAYTEPSTEQGHSFLIASHK